MDPTVRESVRAVFVRVGKTALGIGAGVDSRQDAGSAAERGMSQAGRELDDVPEEE